MSRLVHICLALSALVLAAGCSQLDKHAPHPELGGEQILIMIKEPQIRHYRPGPDYVAGYGGAGRAGARRAAEAVADANGLVVVEEWAMPALGVRCFVAQLPAGRAAEDVVDRLNADARVEWAQPMFQYRVLGHNDPYYGLQTAAQILRLDELHRVATGKGVRIAEIDTGVDLRHPDLQGQVVDVQNFVDGNPYAAEVHGTAIAGIIAAKADNGIGIVGVAPGASLLSLRACWQSSDATSAVCSSFTLAKAMQYALRHGAQVINLSLTGPRDRLLERLIEASVAQGIAVVAATDPDAPEGGFPGSYPLVIAVAVHGDLRLPPGTLLAPGEQILTTTPMASWGFLSGSSYSAAHVTGVVALLLERSSTLKPREVYALLSLDPLPADAPAEPRLLNACAALAQVVEKGDCDCCKAAATRDPRPQGRRRPS